MTSVVADAFEPSSRLRNRWIGSFLGALMFHAAVVAAVVVTFRTAEPEDGGLLLMDLPPLAVEATSAVPDNAENATDETTAPPPADAAEPREEPPPPEAVEKAEPEPPAETVEPPSETAPEPVADPPVPEAPLAPEPEVVLPKPVDEKPVEKKPTETERDVRKPVPKKAADRRPDATKDGKKAGPKSTSKPASAAASGGKFSPNAISRPQPAYPAGARASRVEGYVVVRYTVAPSGAVTGASVVSASPPGVFNGVTLSAVRKWRFRPSSSGGSGTTTVRFKLR
jgi:protein TonB